MTEKNSKNKVADIARIAGVSPGTVSNALNNRKGVSDKKRQEILQIASSLGYERLANGIAENALRFIIFKRHGSVVDDTPFFSQLIGGIERESRLNGYELIITHITAKEAHESNMLQSLLSDGSKGVLLLATEMIAADLKLFEVDGAPPIVLLDSSFRGGRFNTVLINNADGAYKATKHLIEMGHRKIGLLHSSAHINNFHYRRAAFYETMKDYGLLVKESYELLLSPTLEGAYSDMKRNLIEFKREQLPTAFFAENDIIALGAMRALQEHGLRVPQDISLVGFDDMPFTDVSNPRLSTVRVRKGEMGQTAVKMLLESIENQNRAIYKNQLCTELITRDSVCRIKHAAEIRPTPNVNIL